MTIHQMLLAAGGLSEYPGGFSGPYIDHNTPANAAGCTLTLKTDGTWTLGSSSNLLNDSGNWVLSDDAAPGNAHWVRATLTSGVLTTGTTGAALALSSNISWSRTANTGNATAVLTIEIATDSAMSNIVYSTSVEIGYDHS